jgi:hypothetical protein
MLDGFLVDKIANLVYIVLYMLIIERNIGLNDRI